MTKKKYSLNDFYTKTNNENATKMPLLFDGEDTGMYLLVTGIEARSVAQHRFESQKDYAAMVDSDFMSSIKNKAEKKKFEIDESERIKVKLASKLVTAWSFGDEFSEDAILGLLNENQGLADSVIAHASTAANYFAKK